MRGVKLIESDKLNEALSGNMTDKPLVKIRLLAKYYYGKGMDKEEVFYEINNMMNKYYIMYEPSKWRKIINDICNQVKKSENYNIIDIKKIPITIGEWDNIVALDNKQLEKVAFAMLVYCKINKIRNPNSENIIYTSVWDILGEAGITSKEDNLSLLYNLIQNKYIEKGKACDSNALKINYIDEDSDIKFYITNFTKISTYYNEYKNNKKYTECVVCGKRIVMKSNSIKYCTKCSKEKNLENTRLRVRKYREKVKSNELNN